MRGVIGLAAFIVIAFFIGNLLLSYEMTRDHGRQSAMAFGTPRDGLMQVHLGVAMMVVMADPPEVEAYAACLRRVIIDADLRAQLGEGARKFARTERSGEAAAERVRAVIEGVIEGGSDTVANWGDP